jgi:TolB-like protein/Flp pilus assembly protein TadD
MYDEEGIYGDAVNIAARVQALGLPGSVMLSEKVVDEIKNQPGFRIESFGKHELKNIYVPIGIHAIAEEGFNVPTQAHVQRLTGTNPKSIAVLPFTNYSQETENEFFSDGITEEIINALTTIKDLKVASRTSVFTYKKEIKDVREIGKELNVSTVLEGSVRKAGNKIRVTAQLISTDDGFHIWSNNFDGDLQDIFAFQDEIARKIVDKLEDSFSDQEKKKIYESSTDSVEAYTYYLQGLFYWNKRTPEAVYKAIDYFDRAIGECDTYVNALASLANCYTYLGTIGHMPSERAFLIAEKYAVRAIELNSTRADSYIALGYVNLLFKWDFDSAEANFHKAITMEPDNSEARQALSLYYRIMGDYDKMLDQAEAAVKIDPLSLPALLESGRAHWVLGNYDKALNAFNEALELDRMFRAAYEGKAAVYVSQNNFDKALRMIKKYAKLIDSKYRGASQLAYIYAKMGDKDLAEENISRMKKRSEEEPNHNLSIDFAMVYAALGDRDLAFEYLQKAVDGKMGSVLLIHSLPFIKDLKDDPRYEQIEKQIGLANESIGIK